MWMLFLWSIWYDMLMQIMYPKETVKLRKKSTVLQLGNVRRWEQGVLCRAEFSCSWGWGGTPACEQQVPAVCAQSPLRISHQSVFKSNHMMCRRGPLALHCQVLFPLLFSPCPCQWYPAVKPDLPCVTEKQIQCLQRLQLIAWGWFHVSLSLMLLPQWVSKE